MYSESGAHESMLTKPGATAIPCASTSRAPLRLGQIADRDDALAAHADIGLPRLRAAAVVDRSMANDHVVFLRSA